jgi:hypothetical protein
MKNKAMGKGNKAEKSGEILSYSSVILSPPNSNIF